MINRSNLKTLFEKWFTLKTKDNLNREEWFNQKINSSYDNGVFDTE